jgi:flagellar protein FlbT
MALKLELKAGERMRVGDSIVVNEGRRARLRIEGGAPVLRERDMADDDSESPVARLHALIQGRYLSGETAGFAAAYAVLAARIAIERPGSRALLDSIDGHVAAGALYMALKAARRLADHAAEKAEAIDAAAAPQRRPDAARRGGT